MNNLYYYEVILLWNSVIHGKLSSPKMPGKIEMAIPPEFPKGKKEKWTPEHLFIATISSSLMSTFLLVAENSKFEFISFESNAVGKIEKVDGKLVVTEITLKPKLTIPLSQNESRAKTVLKMSENACDISNSVKTKITLESIITVQ